MNNNSQIDLDEYQSSLWAAKSAKIICSAVFLSGRDPEEALENSVLSHDVFHGKSKEIFSNIQIDWENKTVGVTLNGAPPRIAKFYGSQGSITLPLDAKDIFFKPVKVRTTLPDPKSQAWPMGDRLPDAPLPPEIDETELKRAVEAAFADPEAFTTAFLVLYKGRIIAERYDLGVDKDTQLESWSMGKSITATLIGLLIHEGHFNLEDPAPVPQWQVGDDPRSKIRISDLLRMSSGLKFSGAKDPPNTYKHNFPDHEYVYSGSIDVFQFSVNQPLEFPPNRVGRYRNCDPLVLGYIIKKTVTKKCEDYLAWPQKALFDRIGIRKQVLETDPYGNFVMTGFDYGTPRNWARLGLLYLRDGIWNGERILPEGFVDFVSTPAPSWEKPEYGGLFWVNGTNRWNLPNDVFYMAGVAGQLVIIDRTHDLVIVRMGHRRGIKRFEKNLNKALKILMEAIEFP